MSLHKRFIDGIKNICDISRDIDHRYIIRYGVLVEGSGNYAVFLFYVYVQKCICCVVESQKSKNCQQRQKTITSGRSCKKACQKKADCKGSNKRCICDDICGLSCVNVGK